MRRGLSELIKVGHVRGEGEYFHDIDVELIEHLRASDECERERSRNAEATKRRSVELERERAGIVKALQVSDPEIVCALQALDYTPDTAPLLFLTPLLRLAWTDGTVSRAERTLILHIAREHGLHLEASAISHLEAWLDRPPRERLLEGSWSVIKSMLRQLPAVDRRDKICGLLLECRAVAALTGGVLKHKASATEQHLLHAMEQELAAQEPAAAPVPDLDP